MGFVPADFCGNEGGYMWSHHLEMVKQMSTICLPHDLCADEIIYVAPKNYTKIDH